MSETMESDNVGGTISVQIHNSTNLSALQTTTH